LLEGCEDLLGGTDNIAVIDHHATTAFAPVVAYRRCTTSNAELVWEVLGKPRDALIRKALIAGIVTDTGHLRYATGETFATLSEMVDDEINFQDIYTMFREEVSYSQKVALFKALQRMRVVRAGPYIVVKTSIGSFESFIARTILNLGADVAIIVNEKRGQRIVGRAGTRAVERGVDLSAIMHEVGLEFDGDGGGHPPAAGAKNVSDFKTATERVLETVVATLRGKRK
jgi:nanoRNase/pAp phosphatase (c-di-AMP/oligoRNAs hydrolase)